MADRIPDFATFWPFYVAEHANAINRRLHFIGTSLGITLILLGIATGRPLIALGWVPAAYGFAWLGHFGFEKNKPASFHYPWWSFCADLKMYALTWSGRMGAEVTAATAAR
jgi:hypothetical protein